MAEIFIIASASIIAAGHFTAAYLGLFWNPNFYWIDIPLHFLGGVLVVSFFWWVAHRWPKFNVFHPHFGKDLLILVALVALVGVFWEFLEFGYDYLFVDSGRFNYLIYSQLSKSDTMSDLFFDILGGFVAALILRKTRRP